MQEKPRNVRVFKDKLIPHTEHGKKTKTGILYQTENRDDIVVRPLQWEKEVEKRHFRPIGVEEISAEDYARIAKQHFDELNRFGIESPVQFVVAQRDKVATAEDRQREVYALVDNIKVSPNPDKAQLGKEYARIRAALLAYYTEKFEKGGSFLSDLFNDRQYAYGKRRSEKTDHLYLVDVGPYILNSIFDLHTIVFTFIEVVQRESEYFNIKEYKPVVEGFEALLKVIQASIGKTKTQGRFE